MKDEELTYKIIGAANEVHSVLGAGLLESIYEKALSHELQLRGLATISQQKVSVIYKSIVFEESLRFDLLVENKVLLELKSVEKIMPIHKAQLLSYMKLLDIKSGLIINFHETTIKQGLTRLFLP